ncbi:MAG TPA: GGDEF domain-containing protein [Chloroflexota bacterium]|nr:GGDEF domain-containing protein [Chloroflexota bacterium]
MVIPLWLLAAWPLLALVSAGWALTSVRSHEQRQRLCWTITALQRFNQRAADRVTALERQALEDELTGLNNRRYLDADLPRELERTRRFGRELTLAVLDLDDFKQINDGWSHQVGDAVLQALARILVSSCRAMDSVVRYGGDEFVLYFPETSSAEGVTVCQRILEQIAAYRWEELAAGLKVAASVGLASTRGHDSAAQLLEAADQQLYEAKQAGKNRLAVAPAPPALFRVA